MRPKLVSDASDCIFVNYSERESFDQIVDANEIRFNDASVLVPTTECILR